MPRPVQLLICAWLGLFLGLADPTLAQTLSLSDVFEKVDPAVVVIHTMERAHSSKDPTRSVTGQGLGSGVIVSDDGLIMTAAHVVQVADAVSVRLADGRKIPARVIASAQSADVALLQLDHTPPDMTVAVMGDSNKVRIGEKVFIIGAPLGIEHTLTVGHISGRRVIPDPFQQPAPLEFLQTDAAINQGNSGGPVFNMSGQVIGLVSFIMTQSGGSDGIGFASAINTARELLLRQRTFWTGLEINFISGALARALNLPQPAGMLVQRVAENSPGGTWGLKPGTVAVMIGNQRIMLGGDVILEIQGIKVTEDLDRLQEIRETIWSLNSASQVEMKVLRNGQIISLASKPLVIPR